MAPPCSYVELLFHAGYLDARRLLSLVQAWRNLFASIQPQLLLADHAPTAQLAARTLGGMATAVMGTGFFIPPAVAPLPSFREWERVDPARLAQTEARALATCNALLAQFEAAPLTALHDLVAADQQFLLTWPELDHYGAADGGSPGRQHAQYWGPLPARDQDGPAVWPVLPMTATATEPDRPRLFAYLKGEYGGVERVLQCLRAGPWLSLVHVTGLRPDMRQRFTHANLAFSDGPVAMAAALSQAQAVLCHAGSGTVCSALQAGVPVLMLPMHAEQLLFARRVKAAQAGHYVLEADLAKQLPAALQQVLVAGALRTGAQALAARHGATQAGDVALRVALRCEALMAGPDPSA
ncbi:glycosyltransferase [Roseateles sp.]|uniref:glycosyltransferase n=1 Tax=Roseateles sp. TaxID=1971397 RepID=UPI00286BFD53|nr:nucleotide disphospho-sugar-binding domain-containing protein [Roseateles sp.]